MELDTKISYGTLKTYSFNQGNIHHFFDYSVLSICGHAESIDYNIYRKDIEISQVLKFINCIERAAKKGDQRMNSFCPGCIRKLKITQF